MEIGQETKLQPSINMFVTVIRNRLRFLYFNELLNNLPSLFDVSKRKKRICKISFRHRRKDKISLI